MEITLYQDIEQGLYHTALVQTGFALAAARRLIRLRLAFPRSADPRKIARGDNGVLFTVARSGRPHAAVWVDISDSSEAFSLRWLNDSDVYLKRSFYRPDVSRLDPEHARKVIPFGLNYACVDPRTFPSLAFATLVGAASPHPSLGNRSMARTLSLASKYLQYCRLLRPTSFEAPPSAAKKQQLLFQTRLWSSQEARGDDVDAINSERIRLVRALKKNFGDRFVGGIIPTDLAREMCPDLIATHRGDQASYAALVRESAVGIYSRGLHHSIAWKLPEYLAASVCVVTSPLRNEIPAALRSDTEVAYYDSPDECVRKADEILTDPERQAAMRQQGFEYYKRHCEPAAHMVDCASRAYEHAQSLRDGGSVSTVVDSPR